MHSHPPGGTQIMCPLCNEPSRDEKGRTWKMLIGTPDPEECVPCVATLDKLDEEKS